LWLTIDAKIAATIGKRIAMTNKTAVRKRVASAMTNANANRKIAATVTKRKVIKKIRMSKLTLEVAR